MIKIKLQTENILELSVSWGFRFKHGKLQIILERAINIQVKTDPIHTGWVWQIISQDSYNNKQQQQQLSHLSQVFGVGYMNQKRITPDRAHGLAFSTHSYRAICFH